ncbi:spore germination protein [Priestia sp. Y58]|uniref:GerAB/ArcD/ProY family transporter n=1 Tax=Priestia TaxID=2800373 RepID=UPI001C8D71C9|nr:MULTISPECIES: GerAB/ArcD/ProY family transporter [Priestia]MBX9987373.1 GerAB/ArcD/ProY family transporter [Priestia aryabhattai]MBX9998754.1 GerAB/ArcD/ProY family transporter [Priestia aryabhattai]MCZ8494413.1 GerAB/ArcD/ProY family transporter [Priestia megaterium]MDG0032185.1 spore germination protein [Priestia sp. Y58]MDG0060188.1 spore germination protein [Priestia sp. P5]
MSKIKIDGIQLFCMMFIFTLGSTLLLDIGKGAKQDAWMVPLLATVFGCVLYLVYISLYKRYPDMPLTGYILEIFGKYIGGIISFSYIIYFVYIASRVLRDFEELLISSSYYGTSIITLGICMTLVLIYSVYLGVEAFARVVCLCFVIILLTLLILNVLYILGGYIKLENLQPVLANGWGNIGKELYPLGITVPFGELITFTMILPYLNKKSQATKVGLSAIIIGGIFLTINSIVLLCVLGPDVVLRSSFPALTAVSYINIGGFIQRLDTLILILMVILGFVKITIYFFCAVIGATDLFRIKPSVTYIYLIGGVIFFSSLMIAPSYQAHINEGLKVVPYLLHIPLHIGIPLLLLITAFIKQKIKPSLS